MNIVPISAREQSDAPETGPACRGRPRSAEADRAILDATLDILAADGYRSLTMAGVAHDAGVSTATLYRRWASKEDLVMGALAYVAELRSPAVPDTGTLRGDLTELLNRMTDMFTDRSGRIVEGLLSETLRNKELGETIRRRFTEPRLQELGTILRRAAERGEIAPVPDVSVALSLIIGPIHQRLLVSGEPVNRRVVGHLVDLLVRAFGSE
jgi:AcrR family transcriptional regulator